MGGRERTPSVPLACEKMTDTSTNEKFEVMMDRYVAKFDDLPDILTLTSLEEAIELMQKAIESGEPIGFPEDGLL